nr:SusC/RagA family TonB-linked outer membrane protein [Chitinophagaceae bacterium]
MQTNHKKILLHRLGCILLMGCFLLKGSLAYSNWAGRPDHIFQQRTLSGKVTDDQGQPLAGVSILIKGNSSGVSTGQDGSFEIAVPSKNVTLTFSFVGYATQELAVGNQSVVNIRMTAENKALNEVIVTGYSSQSRRDIVGAVSSVQGKDLVSVAATSFAQQLQGRAPGVQVGNDNSPGGGVAVRIRGIGSITGGNDPLYIIDGVPTQGGLNQLNPNDIENIQILKDASTASIYGARANNGVVIVTTKKGKSGETKISLDAYTGIQNAASKAPGFLTAQQYGDIYWTASRNAGLVDPVTGNPVSSIFGNGPTAVVPDYMIPVGAKEGDPNTDISHYSKDPLDPEYGISKFQITKVNKQGTDWYNALLKSSPVTNINMSVTGGNDKGRYALSAGYFDQEGILKFTNFKRYSIRMNTEFNVKKAIRIGENFQFSYTDGVNTVLRNADGPMTKIYQIPAFQPVFDIAGNYSGTRDKQVGGENPYAFLERNKDNHNTATRAFGNIYMEVDFLKNLTGKTSVGLDYLSSNLSNFRSFPYENYLAQPQAATLNVTNSNTLGLTWTNTLNYTKNITDDHKITVLVGTEAVKLKGTNFGTTKQGFAFEDIDYRYLDAANTVTNSNGTASASSLFSLFGKADYSYKDRYILSATIRRDASSRFAEAYRWGTFPAFGAAWRISDENFMKGARFINELKLRAGWGKTGNQEIDPYNPYGTYGTSVGTSSYDINGSSNSVVAGFD